jgi:hypothetical protein
MTTYMHIPINAQLRERESPMDWQLATKEYGLEANERLAFQKVNREPRAGRND